MSTEQKQCHNDLPRQKDPHRSSVSSNVIGTSSSSKGTPTSSTSTTTTSSADMTRRMICGGVAGMVAKTATNPLERIKMLSQTGEGTSVIQLYKRILRTEGVIGLWAGNGANLLRVFPAKSIVFSTNDLYLSFFRTMTVPKTTNNESGVSMHPMWSFLAGGCAGMTASALTYPLDLARGRIAGTLAAEKKGSSSSTSTTSKPKLTASTPQKAYHGIVRTIVLTVQDEGIAALYKGITPTLIGALPYEGIKFGTVGLLEQTFPLDEHSSSLSSPVRKMIFGGLGGVMAGLITYPNDTVRRLLQLQGSRRSTTTGAAPQFSGYWDCVRQTYRQEGIGRFYRGVGINIVRMAPNAAVQFGTYDILKKWTSNPG